MVKLSDGNGKGKGRKPRPAAPTPSLPTLGEPAPAAKKPSTDVGRSRAIRKALRADPARTDKDIAAEVGTRAPEVLRHRRKLEDADEIPRHHRPASADSPAAANGVGHPPADEPAPAETPAPDTEAHEPAAPAEPAPAKRRGRKKPAEAAPVEPMAEVPPAEAPAPESPAADEKPIDPTWFSPSGYTALYGGACRAELGRDPETGKLAVRKLHRLANFKARIVGETVTDDGAEQAREFAVEVERADHPPVTIGVPVERFGSLDWVLERLGPVHVVRAGNGTRDHLRAAIQEFTADDVPRTTTYAHTGWREVGGRWVYLHAGGAVGASGGRVSVRLDGAAAGFHLPDPPTGDELRAAVRASLGVLDDLAPDAVVFPLLATVYRAALGPTDYALWLVGLTGAHKSELAALAQQHYGAGMVRGRLPGNWSSTDNALEGLAFAVKDAVLVVDDFAPPAARADADRMHRVAERLIRGQGNSAGRQRMRADGTLRPPKPPRGLILGTGEDIPRGHSIAARLCITTVGRGAVDLSRLSACQLDAREGRYAAAMAGFLAHLAPRYADVRAGLDAERVQLRDRFVGRFPHARTPDIISNLLLGLHAVLRFAEDVGAIDAATRAVLWGRGQAAFLAVAGAQAEHQRTADPVAQFPDLLASVVSSGRGYIAGEDGKEPGIAPSPAAWGWEEREGKGTFDPKPSLHPRGKKVGWVIGGELYLDPNATYAAVMELVREQGTTFPLTAQTLWERLKEAGRLMRFDKGRTVYPKTLEGVRRRVLHLAVGTIFPDASPAEAGSVPLGRPDCPTDGGQVGHENSLFPLGKPGFVPPVPLVPLPDRGGGGQSAGASDGYDEIAR